MEEPDWAKILSYLHNHNGELRCTAAHLNQEDTDNKDHERALYGKLREELTLNRGSDEDIIETHKHLQNTGLIQFHTHSNYAGMELTNDGFKVAHERELSKRDNKISQSLVFFTFVLVIAQIIGVVPIGDIGKAVSGLVVLIGMMAAIRWTEIGA